MVLNNNGRISEIHLSLHAFPTTSLSENLFVPDDSTFHGISLMPLDNDGASMPIVSTKNTPIANAKSQPIRILIIDDDPSMRESFESALDYLKAKYDIVSSGEESLIFIKNQCYDIIFLDLVLHTGSHGIEIYHKIKKVCENNSSGKQPKVIFMTASGSKEKIFEEANKLNSNILRKPFSFDEIEYIIEEAKKSMISKI